MTYVPMTTERWMATVREHKDNLRQLILDWHPVSRITQHRDKTHVLLDDELIEVSAPHGMPITAPTAEMACQTVRRKIIAEEGDKQSPVERFETALAAENVSEIMSLLSSAWFGVPESTDCWRIPGFSVACDLMDDPPEVQHD